MNNRRDFLKQLIAGAAFLSFSSKPLFSYAKQNLIKITVLHTNDVHSRIEPFPITDPKYPGMGGFARRAAIIKRIRQEEKNVLLFDAGDIFQGTPYFNKYLGELELKLMSEMGYDAATIGNHEFDNGLQKLSEILRFSAFPFICCNYNFNNTPMAGKTIPYKVYNVDDIKIGVLGLGIELAGLVSAPMYGNTVYIDAAEAAAQHAYLLKKDFKCDLVICLSHLGLKYENEKISDMKLAKQSKNIDVIIGGHSHTFIDKPYRFRNSDNKEVIICQVGYNGLKLGRLDFYFERKSKLKIAAYYTTKKINNQV